MNFESRVLALVGDPAYAPLTLKAISRRLKVDVEAYPEFRSTVKGLVRSGRLDFAKDKTLTMPDTSGSIVGTFRRTSKGFGFVRPSRGDRADQIYIPVDAGKDASTGDEVRVRVVKRSRGPGFNSEGRVIEVVRRASGLFVGTYFERNDSGFVQVDGTAFQEPIPVGDPGAKGAKPGDKVALEMARYPSPYQTGQGVITEVLGPRGQPGVDTLTIIRAFGLPEAFDDDELIEAREQAKAFSEAELAGRTDLREVLTVTIDPANARDFDDAITLARDDRGFWSLGVHIADVSHFVRPGTPLDVAAKKRGTSVYLPDRVLPMLPEILSNSLASLQAGQVRYTMTAQLEFDRDGVRTDAQFSRSAIRVDRRFSYEQAYRTMTKPDQPAEGDPPVEPEVRAMLGRMLELAMILRKRRIARGALELNMPEVQVDLGDEGQVVGAHLASHDESHQVIEEFMLAANEAVASFLNGRQVGFLRRVHPIPEPTKLDNFAEFARGLGLHIDQPQSRFELQKVLAEAAGRPEEYAVHYGLLRSLKQATYTPEAEGHFALASEDYCHFTSPIRRYPDLQVHRQLGSIIDGRKPKGDLEELGALAEHCTRTERRAEAAERELIKVKLLTHLEGRVGETFHAVIIAVEDFGFFARLIELPAEGLVHVSTLGDDYYYLEAATHTLIGRRSGRRFRLGDRLEVRVDRVDVDRRTLDLALLDGSALPDTDAPTRPERTRPPRMSPSANESPRPKPRTAKGKPKGTKSKGKGKKKG